MTVVYEIAIRAIGEDAQSVAPWFKAGPAKLWCKLPQLNEFHVYFPAQEGATDPYVDDGAGPLALALLGFADERSLRAAVNDAAFSRGLQGMPPDGSVTAEAMLRKFYSGDGEIGEQVLDASFSYVVRYHRPAKDERAFVAHYVADHPALLAKLPNIRSVLCYFPLPWRHPNGLASPDYMLGNEVVFDSIEHFNVAMASPIRHELRAHYRSFPRFSGRNTHYPMLRTRLV
jgi:uncharacterized protein (TIGR02118 family)